MLLLREKKSWLTRTTIVGGVTPRNNYAAEIFTKVSRAVGGMKTTRDHVGTKIDGSTQQRSDTSSDVISNSSGGDTNISVRPLSQATSI
jgi:hypothetical protein